MIRAAMVSNRTKAISVNAATQARCWAPTKGWVALVKISWLSANWNPFKGANVALSQLIFTNATQPFIGAQQRAWVAAFTLIAMVLVLTIAARIIANRFATR